MSLVRPWTSVAATVAAALLLAPTVSYSQSRVIINRGAAQQASVTLAQDSNVNIDPVTGNVVVDCAPSALDSSVCLDPIGSVTPPTAPPAFTIAASGFSNPQTAGQYPALTQFTLAPVGLSGVYEACRRLVTGAGTTNWSGLALPGDVALSTVTVPEASSTYNFSLRCFADGGARTSNTLTVSTSAVIQPPPDSCPSNWNGQPWANFTRSSERVFTDLRRLTGGFATPFPQPGGLVIFGATVNQYVSVEISLSSVAQFEGLSRELGWIESQGGGAGAAALGGVYFSITKCSGDFRIPANTPDPVEPTLSLGCRNIALSGQSRFIVAGMAYAINGSPSNTSCALAVGTPQIPNKYYINFMTVNPLDGYQPNEHNCIDAGARCGVQLQSQ